MVNIVDTRADTVEAVAVARDQRRHRARMRGFRAHRRAVFAIGGNIEHRSTLGLQRERFFDEFRPPGVVDTGRHRRKRAFGAPKCCLR